MNNKNTKLWLRVFFVLAFISLLGILWQIQKKSVINVREVGGSFSEGIIGTPRFINPVLAQSQSDKDLTELIFSRILSVNPDGTTSYYLGEELVQDQDKKKYTLKLKPGIKFHDGTLISSSDLIYTLERIQDPLIKSPLYTKWEGIQIDQVDNRTLIFTLEQEYSDFPKNLEIGILPKHIWEEVSSDEFIFDTKNTNPIGSGSYQVNSIEYTKDRIPHTYTLTRATDSNAFIEKINLHFYENESELTKAFSKNEINAAYGLSANSDNYTLFSKNENINGKLPRVFGLFFNQKKNKSLAEKEVREYISNSLNREEIIKEVFSGYAYPIYGPRADVQNLNEKNLDEIISGLEKDSWVKNENGIYSKKEKDSELVLSFDLAIPNTEELLSLANLIKDDLKEAGIEIQVRPFDEATLHQKVIRPREYDILLFGYVLEKNTDLYAFWHSSQREDPGLNISSYKNTKVDMELEKLRKDETAADIDRISSEIQKDVPAVFLYSPAFTYLFPEKIKGEDIQIIEKNDRFKNIDDWYINTRKVWKIFIEK